MPTCPICSSNVIFPSRGNNILYLSSAPNKEEMNRKYQNSGDLGQLLRVEFYRLDCGLDPYEFGRAFTLWHEEGKKDNECVVASEFTLFDPERGYCKNIEHVLLVGSLAVKRYTGFNVSDVNGLDVTEFFVAHEEFPMLKSVTAMVNPSMAMMKGVGELRFALQNFANTVLSYQTEKKVMDELYG